MNTRKSDRINVHLQPLRLGSERRMVSSEARSFRAQEDRVQSFGWQANRFYAYILQPTPLTPPVCRVWLPDNPWAARP